MIWVSLSILFVGVCVTLAATGPREFTCPEGWLMFGWNCFKLHQEKRTWVDSRDFCLSEGGHLATIADEQTNQVLTTNLFSNDTVNIWIGLNDIDAEGNYTWADSTANPTYRNWYSDQPNNFLNQDCINIWSFYPGHKWADELCTVKNHFLCQRTVESVLVKTPVFKNPHHIRWFHGTHTLQLETDDKDVSIGKHGDLPGLTLDSNGLVSINVTKNLHTLRHGMYPSDLEFEATNPFGVSSKYKPDISLCLCDKEEQCTNTSAKSMYWSQTGNIHDMKCECAKTVRGRYCEKEIDVCEKCPCGKKSPLHFKCGTGFAMKTVNNKVVCADINECTKNNGGCDQGCRNIDGSWECFCQSGFTQRGNKCIKHSCPTGWTKFRNECFKLFKEKKTWQSARAQCLSQGAHLAFVPDVQTHSFLFKEFISKDIKQNQWIALNDIKKENTFEWQDSTKKITYTRWGRHQPNNVNNQDCVGYWAADKGRWADNPCSFLFHFICQKTAVIEHSCPTGWTKFRNECFKLFKEKKTWQSARAQCLSQGAHLAFVPDVQTHSFLFKEFISKDIKQNQWIALNDIKKENTFEWQDSTKKITYTRWGRHQPNNVNNQDCVGYWAADKGRWADNPCSFLFHFICQKTAVIEPICPPGWILYRNECFKLFREAKTWQMSRAKCLSEGAHLAFVPDAPTHQFLFTSFVSKDTKHDIWIALNDIKRENKFEWADSKKKITFTRWGPSQPNNNQNQDCVCYWKEKQGRWADYRCSNKFHFICQKTTVIMKTPGFKNPKQITWHLGIQSLQLETDARDVTFETYGGLPGLTLESKGLVAINITENLLELRNGRYPSILEFVATTPRFFPSVYKPNIFLCLCEKKEQCQVSKPGYEIGNVHNMGCNCQGKADGRYCEKIKGCEKCPCQKKSARHFECPNSFEYELKVLNKEAKCHACGGVYNANQGELKSPRYPLGYPNNFLCQWEIQVDEGYGIKLSFKPPFSLLDNRGSADDYVEVFDVTDVGAVTSKGRWSGTDTPPVQTSTNTKMLVIFHSDGNGIDKGFHAVWDTVSMCGDVFNASQGQFTSPEFPNNYPNNLDCKWEIMVPSGQRVLMEFGVTFDIQMDSNCSKDNVKVSDYSNGTMISKGIWCGSTKPSVIISDTSHVMVVFHSDGDTHSGKGFTASWNAVGGCGGTFNTIEGSIISPNYPYGYPEDQDCRWEIDPPRGSNFTLHFDPLFELEADVDCAWDSIQVFRGNELAGRWCGSKVPPPIMSYGEKLVLVFESDDGNPGKGFLASWKI